ncbi:hypothetical protein B0H10DRAFT_1937756 [Mycena sp. CBHHK59/15]|nr:hypothetical protein B0H10DRAFT_1937756 [Mycena sp. CBHHK59/15]
MSNLNALLGKNLWVGKMKGGNGVHLVYAALESLREHSKWINGVAWASSTALARALTDDSGIIKAVRNHIGQHSHARPPVKCLAAKEITVLDLQVRQNPQATAQQLCAGGDMSQIEKSKVQQDLIPAVTRNSGFQLLDSFSALKSSFETPWIVAADLLDHQYICMQTPFMRDVLLRDSVQSWHAENLEPKSGRHGVITDSTHNFFKQGILLTSLVFSQVLFCWVVVLYTWIGNQDQEHHVPHFKHLVQVIAEICTHGLGFTFDNRVFSAILDFSNAQRNSFIEAFVDYMCSRIPGWSELSSKSRASERANLRTRVQALLISCKVHWRRSTHKIKQVIAVQFQYQFEGLITILEGSSTTPIQFLQAVADIHREFPEVCPWLSWWILPGNGGMIFPAMQQMPTELRAQLPSSTNSAESAHNLLYNVAGRNHDIWEGVCCLYWVQRETEMLYEAVTAGHVQARFQGLRPRSRISASATWYENDGWAPDTHEHLAAVAKLEADLAAQKSNLTESEHFIAINATPTTVEASGQPLTSSKGSPDMRLLQSYKWDDNSCFIDASMEAIFRAFIVMSDGVRAEFLRRIRTECPNSGLRDIVEHFWLCGLLSGAIIGLEKSGKKKETPSSLHGTLIIALDAGQRNVKHLIHTKWGAGQYVAENVHTQILYEFPIYRDDLALAQAHIHLGAGNPSLGDHLAHCIPWNRYGTM